MSFWPIFFILSFIAMSYMLEYMALNEREGELFKRDFWKLFEV